MRRAPPPAGGAPGAPGLFLPWSYPAALGTICGIIGAYLLPRWSWIPIGLLVVLLALVRGTGALHGTRRPASRLRSPAHRLRLPRGFVALLGGFLVLGGARFTFWERQASPVADLLGQELRWTGYHDGDFFHAELPVRAKLAVAYAGDLPVGRLELTGAAQLPPGKRNPGGFDHAGHLRRRGAFAQLFVNEVNLLGGAPPLRERLRHGVEAGLGAQHGALMAAMTLGIRSDLGELSDSFMAAGLAHLLALSGLHVTVLLLVAGRLMAPLGRARPYLLLLVTAGFVALVGPSPSVVRAAAMAAAVLIGMALGIGRFEAGPVFALALVIGLMAEPQMLFDLSFQLSYLAVAGLILFLPPAARLLGLLPAQRPPLWRTLVIGGAATSLAAQLPSLAVVAGAFGTVPLLSPLVNVVAVPVSSLMVPLGFAAGLLGLVAEPLAWLVNRLTLVLAAALTATARLGERLPAVSWGEVGPVGHLGWLLAVAAGAAWAHGRLRPRRLVMVLALAGAGSALAGPRQAPPDIWYFDVGQGDSVLIRLPGPVNILVDGGGTPFSDFDVGERVVVRALRALGVRRLDLVIASHPDADHVEGLLTVLQRLPVGLLVTGPPASGVALDQALRQAAERRGVDIHHTRRGERLAFGAGASAGSLTVLNPPARLSGTSANEASVAFVLDYGGQPRALFLGDLGSATELELAVPPVDVLMVGHHGSRHSTSEHLLLAANPRLAIISVGRNGYGHPHPDVLARLGSRAVPVLTTAANGAVRVDLARPGVVHTFAGGSR